MANPKSWTATDLVLGTTTIRQDVNDQQQAIIRFEQRYQFQDAQEVILEQIATGRLVDEILVGDVPQNILDALTTIKTWLYNKALEQEGMQE